MNYRITFFRPRLFGLMRPLAFTTAASPSGSQALEDFMTQFRVTQGYAYRPRRGDAMSLTADGYTVANLDPAKSTVMRAAIEQHNIGAAETLRQKCIWHVQRARWSDQDQFMAAAKRGAL